MNISEDKLGTTKNVQESGRQKISPLEKSDSIISNDNLKAYGESGRDNNPEKG